ncbi:hypothetical protein Vadar_023415 [Vaccinium darrowii]|uniref:Uncharacterized protein n=1 Tax=Vaccinium darrowii TaxID=229202 RepID=A0ACB7YQ54_9ERIC|nr:hypothetical protein Vadar_023415 [Vaccinium darrowii]
MKMKSEFETTNAAAFASSTTSTAIHHRLDHHLCRTTTPLNTTTARRPLLFKDPIARRPPSQHCANQDGEDTGLVGEDSEQITLKTMSSFTGTQQKCKACEKTVYSVELLSADGVPYHKSCFKCSHCKGTLKLSNYSSMEGVVYCRPHFEQLFKETASFNKNFQSPAKSAEKRTPELTRSASKAASMFSGTQEKCATCGKTAYPLEKVTVESQAYHKSCFKCSHGGCTLSPSNYAALEGILYCKHHFSQLFKEKGSYNHLIKSALVKRPTASVPEA